MKRGRVQFQVEGLESGGKKVGTHFTKVGTHLTKVAKDFRFDTSELSIEERKVARHFKGMARDVKKKTSGNLFLDQSSEMDSEERNAVSAFKGMKKDLSQITVKTPEKRKPEAEKPVSVKKVKKPEEQIAEIVKAPELLTVGEKKSEEEEPELIGSPEVVRFKRDKAQEEIKTPERSKSHEQSFEEEEYVNIPLSSSRSEEEDKPLIQVTEEHIIKLKLSFVLANILLGVFTLGLVHALYYVVCLITRGTEIQKWNDRDPITWFASKVNQETRELRVDSASNSL